MHLRRVATGGLALLLSFAILAPSFSSALTKEVGSGESSYTVVDPREYPIIFIHGAAGSELWKGGTNLWPGSVGGIANDSSASQMALNANGKTDCCGTVTAKEVLKYGAGEQIGFLDARFAGVYQGFYDYMDAQGFGYEQQEDGKVFFDFVYDWRKDNRMATRSLDVKVNQVLKETKAEKVILVGHSMGGIQIRLYMNDANRAKKVGGVIFLATPHHGAPQVYWAYTYGYNFGNIKVSDTRMWEVMKNWPAGYQLLPDYPAIQDDETGKFWTVEEQMTRADFISEQEYKHAIAGMGRTQTYQPTYGLPNKALAKDAINFHRGVLGDSVKKYPWVKYYMVAGTGQDTVQYFTAKKELRPGFSQPGLVLTKVKSTNGDGTVPAAGAKIQGVDEFVTVVGEHGAIPSTPAAQTYVTKYRESINDEKFRRMLVDRTATFARRNLPRAEQMKPKPKEESSEGDSEENMAKTLLLLLFFGVPDEEKIKLRDDIRSRGAALIQNARVNVHFPEGDEPQEKEDTLYLIINNFELMDSGNGSISPATLHVTLDSYETFNAIISGQLDIEKAYKDGNIRVAGTGVKYVLTKVAEWVSKYGWGK